MRRPQRYKTRRTYGSRNRKKTSWMPFLLVVSILGFFFWAVFQFFSMLFSGIQTESITANLDILKGRIEFQLSGDNSTWTSAFSHQNFVEGDSLKTAKKSRSELSIDGKNILFLDEKTELKIEKLRKNKNNEYLFEFKILAGQFWNAGLSNKEKSSPINITTPDLYITSDNSSVFNISSNLEEEVISVVKGDVEVLFQETEKKLKIGTGQKIIFKAQDSFLTENDLEPIDIDFINSDWYISNLEKTNPETAQKLRDKKNQKNILKTQDDVHKKILDSDEGLSDIESAKIISPSEDRIVPANEELVVISGTAPLEAYQVLVNNFALSKFQPGDRKWNYYAATKYNTMKPGKNIYSVVVVDRMGKKSKAVNVTLDYQGVSRNFDLEIPAAKKVKAEFKVPEKIIKAEIISEEKNASEVQEEVPEVEVESPAETTDLKPFANPRVTRPAFFKTSPNGVFETSSSVVTFAGNVPAGTQSVKVNGFALRKFKPGDTTFSYIANAGYTNMKEGRNIYTIIAFGKNGVHSKTQIIIEYTPVKL